MKAGLRRSASISSTLLPSRAKFWLYRFDTKTVPYLLIAPFFVLFAIFGMFPIIFNGIVALRHWRLDDPTLTGWARRCDEKVSA